MSKNAENDKPEPWEGDLERLENLIKEREISVPRAVVTFIEDLFKTQKEKKPFPLASAKGLVYSLLFSRTVIILGSIIGSLLLVFQTFMIFRQNTLISNQNDLFKVQNNLSESNRRAALVFELSGILDEIDEELDQIEQLVKIKGFNKIKNLEETIRNEHLDEEGNLDASYLLYDRITNQQLDSLSLRIDTYPYANKFYVNPQLSSRLEGRIIAASKAFRPYKYLNNQDSLNTYLLSPERGQLLISLVESGIALQNIIPKSDFTYADLEGTNFVRNIEYNFVNTETINLQDLNISFGNLTSVNFADVYIENINLNKALLTGTNFLNCSMEGASFTDCHLQDVLISASNLDGAEFKNTTLTRTTIEESNLDSIEPDNVIIDGSTLKSCWLPSFENWFDNYEYEIEMDIKRLRIEKCYTHSKSWISEFRQALADKNIKIDSLQIEEIDSSSSDWNNAFVNLLLEIGTNEMVYSVTCVINSE